MLGVQIFMIVWLLITYLKKPDQKFITIHIFLVMVELLVVEVVLLLLRLNVNGLELEALAFLLLRLDFSSLCVWRNELILQFVKMI